MSTALPDALTGMGALDPDGPWARALHVGQAVMGHVDQLLGVDARSLALELGFEQVWVEPVATNFGMPDATITVLTTEGSAGAMASAG